MSKRLLGMFFAAILMAMGMSAYALEKVNGVYQIGTAEDYFAFVKLVNDGERGANAILTADIDLGTYNTKIATNNSNYFGIFDGAGHTITIDLSEGTDGEGPALFRSIDQCSIIKRLKVQGTLRAGKYKHTAAIANYSSGIIRDCYVDVHVEASFADNADASIGGIVGQLNKLSVLENCLSKIKITGSTTHKCGGIAAWVDADRVNISNCLVINDEESNFNWSDGKSAGLVRDGDGLLEVLNLETYNADSYKNRPKGASANNYVTNDWGKLGKAATVVSSADVASGKVCYQLNSDQSQIRWVQRIGTDPYPVPAVFGTGRVYASAATNCQGMADGVITFSNTGSDTAAKHTYDKYGVCTTCGQFNWNHFDFNNPEKFDIADKSFLISTGDDFFKAETWNRFQNGCKFNLKLTNDVECKPEPGQVIFNTNDWIESNFNGQGHTLTIEMVDINEESAAFFPRPYANKGDFVFENVIMHGKVSSAYTKKGFVGSIASREYGSGSNKMIYRNVYSDVEVSVAAEGDNTSAGFLGVADRTTVFENCIYAGNVNCVEGGGGVAGIVGWANGSTTTLTNCAFIGALNNAGDGSTTLIRNYGSQTYKNVYSLNSYVNEDENSKFTLLENEDAIKSGELAYLLNGREEGLDRFYQKIGEDPVPMPFKKEGALVYTTAENYGCDGKPIGDVTYSNTYSALVPSHQYSDGMCTICGHLEENYVPLVDGWYEIGNAAQFMWWARYAAEVDLSANARLTADIDMEEYSAAYPDRTYPQIGNETTPFYGNFDGQYHTISNLEVNLPGKRGVGLIGVMNSQPSNGFGGLSADDARAAEGVFVKNVVLDETCSILGQGYTGVVGMAANWPGHITISGVLNMGDATVDGGTNGAGLFGCAMGSNCHMTINNCGFIGNIHVLNDTHTENGLFSGWLGQFAEVTNCFAMGKIDEYPDPARSWARHPNYNTVVIKNCYALEGSGVTETGYDGNPEDVTFLPEEEIASGVLTWKANGAQFRNPVWYQTMGEDAIPTPDPSHGVVLYAAETVFNVSEESVSEIKDAVASYYNGMYDEAIAYTVSVEDFNAKVQSLDEVATVIELADALDSVYAKEAIVNASAKVYQRYKDKCEETITYLKEHDDFEGDDRDALQDYLDVDYVNIMDLHEQPDSLIEKEIVRIDEWLALAIKMGYKAGTDVTGLFANTDFQKGVKEGWESNMNKWANGTSTVTINNKPYVGCEAWNTKFDMHQTVKDLKPGYYLVSVQGAFRPSNDRYSYNYAAQVYANDNVNYLQSVIEDYVGVDAVNDGENVYLSQFGGGDATFDWPIYEDGFSTSGEAGLKGYVLHGPSGVAVAGYAGRCKNYIIAKTEGDSLTIGICNPGTNYGNDWTGFTSFNVVYAGEGDEAETYVDKALESMLARANALFEKYRKEAPIELAKQGEAPNYPAALKSALQAAIAAAESAQGTEDKIKAVETLSQLFKDIYEGRQAYFAAIKTVPYIEAIENNNLPLVEKDANGEWIETDDDVFSAAESDALYYAVEKIGNSYNDGTFTIEEAKDAAALNIPSIAALVPLQDEDGYIQISNPKQFVAYRGLVISYDVSIKAKLVDDIDMTGIGMQPVGNDSKRFTGSFDGQGHTVITNIKTDVEGGTGLFGSVVNATIKNLVLEGSVESSQKWIGGIAGITRGNNTLIENVLVKSTVRYTGEGDSTGGGLCGDMEGAFTVNNCAFVGSFDIPNGTNVGGFVSWTGSGKFNNCYVAPVEVVTNNSYKVFIHGGNGSCNNCYAVDKNDEKLSSGEVCYKLNGDNQGENAAWFQTLGTDAYPVLDKTHEIVLYDAVLGYYNDTDPVGIETINTNTNLNVNDGAIYNLSGQRVSRAQKGIFIQNGKKIFVK